jgi:hypothetical protein
VAPPPTVAVVEREHLRQHERFTRADAALEQEIRQYAQNEPIIRHLIYADTEPST